MGTLCLLPVFLQRIVTVFPIINAVFFSVTSQIYAIIPRCPLRSIIIKRKTTKNANRHSPQKQNISGTNTSSMLVPLVQSKVEPLRRSLIFILVEVCIPSWLSMTSVNTCDFGDNYFTMKGDKIPHPLITLIITQISLSKNLFILAKVQRRWLIAKFSTSYLATSQENRTFAATDSATLPIEQRTRAELLLFIGL